MFFHPEGERGPARRNRDEAAKAVCLTCPVLNECRTHALAVREPYGVWGATTEDDRERILLTGDLPSPAAPPSGCRFHTRCPWRQEDRCATERPEPRVPDAAAEGHMVACHHAEAIRDGRITAHEVSLDDVETTGPTRGPERSPSTSATDFLGR